MNATLSPTHSHVLIEDIATIEDARTTRSKATTGAKILVVDDEPDVIRALTMRLKFAGYEVIVAADGASATRMAITEQPDLIILDIGLPCGDGHMVAHRLCDNMNSTVIPVIFLTARTSQADRAKAMEVGAADFITKPFTAVQLLSSVERALTGNIT
jgi:DNA-binding response OmpR family regulator